MDFPGYRFPNGRKKAVVVSYDDAALADKKLVEIFNRHGIKGTFHVNSGLLGLLAHLTMEEVVTLFDGHEISGHGRDHHCLDRIPQEAVVEELLSARVGSCPDVWKAGALDLWRYSMAMKRLEFSADLSKVFNPSSVTLYLSWREDVIAVDNGATFCFF